MDLSADVIFVKCAAKLIGGKWPKFITYLKRETLNLTKVRKQTVPDKNCHLRYTMSKFPQRNLKTYVNISSSSVDEL